MPDQFRVTPTGVLIRDAVTRESRKVIQKNGRLDLTAAELSGILARSATDPVRLAVEAARADATPTAAPATGGALLATDGNSITAIAASPATAALFPIADSGWVAWARGLSKFALRWVEQRATTSMTTKQQQAALASWVPGTKANYLSFLEGTNSIIIYTAAGDSPQVAAQKAYADLLTYLDEARSYGKFRRIFLGTIPPRGSVLARNAAHDWYNRQIRALCAQDGYYVLMDFWSVLVDPASATLSAKANYLRADDGLHPTPKGARAMGKVAADVWNAMGFPKSSLIPTSSNTRALSPSALYASSNPLLIGANTGTVSGTNASGVARAGWRAAVNAGTVTSLVASVVADSEGNGSAQRMVISGASDGALCFIGINGTEALPYQVAGDYLMALAKLKWSGATNVKGIYLRLSTVTANGNQAVDGFATTAATATVADFDNADMSEPFWLFTPATRFSGGTPVTVILSAVVYVLFGPGGGAITLDVSQGGLVNLGRPVPEV